MIFSKCIECRVEINTIQNVSIIIAFIANVQKCYGRPQAMIPSKASQTLVAFHQSYRQWSKYTKTQKQRTNYVSDSAAEFF